MADTQSVSQAIVDYMVRLGIPFAAGVPGHGILAFVDALSERREDIATIMVRHEQSATHLADGYYRASGRPAACFTSVGPGAINTLVGMGTAFADSSAMVTFTANCPTYMFERGAIQGIDMHHWADFTRMALPVTKRSWQITNPRQVPEVVHRAFATATAGRPGPCHIELPMDIQAAPLQVPMPDPSGFGGEARPAGDPDEVKKAARTLLEASRPMILAGGGVISADAASELRELAEYLGIPVVTTIMGKGAIPEDHDLSVFYAGSKASSCGQAVAKGADVILAVGCRFAEWTCSSYAQGETYTIPPQKIIHVDINSWEIGKNYPVEHPIVGDAKLVLAQLLGEIKDLAKPREYLGSAYLTEIQAAKEEWRRRIAAYADDKLPMTTSRLLAEMRKVLPRESIVVGAAGHAQATLFQEFSIYEPRTHLSTGAFSTMGWCIPAAIGAKLAKPDRVVIAVSGDGDFLMTCQELATAAQYRVPVVFCVLNNNGWISIKDLQLHNYGADRTYATEFLDEKREELGVDYAGIARCFGIRSERVETPDQVAGAIMRAQDSDGPYLIEVKTAREYPRSEGAVAGWADFPVPEHIKR